MTIGFFIDEYLPSLHGDITSTIALRTALQALGHTVYIVAPATPGYEDHDDHVIRIPSFDPKILRYKTRLVLLYPGLAKKLAQYKFDIVHSQTQFGMGVLAHETAKRLKVPHISTMHTVFAEMTSYNKVDAYAALTVISLIYPIYFRSMPHYNWARPKGDADWLRLKEQAWWAGTVFLNSTDAVIAPSQHIATALRQHGLTKECNVIPNGLDVAAFYAQAKATLPSDIPKKSKDIWLVSAGRISAEKRPLALLQALQQVPDPAVKLLLIGSGPSEQEVAQAVVDLGLQDRAYVLGRREPADVAAILAHSDVFLLASYRFDNQPMVILEALAAGLPIVYCDDKLTEGLTKNNSLLTDSPTPESFAKAIMSLAAGGKTRKAMAEASAAMAAKFDITASAKWVEAVYMRALDRRKPKA